MINLSRISELIIVVGLTTSCVQLGPQPGKVASIPDRSDKLKNISISIESENWSERQLRQSSGTTYPLYVTVDGQDIAILQYDTPRREVQFGLETGTHTLGVRCANEDPNASIVLHWVHAEKIISVTSPPTLMSFKVGISSVGELLSGRESKRCFIR